MLLKRIRRQQTEQQQIFKSRWERKKSKEVDADHIQERFVWLIFQTNAWFLVNKVMRHLSLSRRWKALICIFSIEKLSRNFELFHS